MGRRRKRFHVSFQKPGDLRGNTGRGAGFCIKFALIVPSLLRQFLLSWGKLPACHRLRI
jgi:hypothetical protein